MKLRVHYQYGPKVRTKTFSGNSMSINEMAEAVSSHRQPGKDGFVTFTDFNCKGFSLPARNIVLMEVID
ncbi:hypothetical protein [Streptomyces althioticus]|uniref:hypothetical protein n=1 Tax=Streptomyces althioticus TaxID=83380 RepID=UPI0033D17676